MYYIMRKTEIADNCYYHVYNRGVDKRKIFMDDYDYARFQSSLFFLNDSKPVIMRFINDQAERNGEPLVEIGAYCLMPNHFHLLIKTKSAAGFTAFMQKLGTSYAMYFNKKHKRTGRLFENAFKINLINKDEYLRHISIYIHTNPLKLLEPQWQVNKINGIQLAHNFLENYKWSSYPHYIKIKKDDILNLDAFPEYFQSGRDYKDFLENWVLNYDRAKISLIFTVFT